MTLVLWLEEGSCYVNYILKSVKLYPMRNLNMKKKTVFKKNMCHTHTHSQIQEEYALIYFHISD